MAGWDGILGELQGYSNPFDAIRRKHLKKLFEYSKRNTILYYSSFITKKVEGVAITDNDMNGFMNAVKGLDGNLGLDLVLHTPGGDPNAAEAIVKYLRDKFRNDIRVIVPQMAMSAGTMIACAAKEIIMGKHSSLGPIDPQYGGISAHEIKKLFDDAKADMTANPQAFLYWKLQLERYPAAFIYEVLKGIELSSDLVKEWLGSCMFNATKDASTISKIVKALNEHTKSKTHARHFNYDTCRSFGLKITLLEEDHDFQDRVLSVHHITMHTLENSGALKIIENHNGKAFITSTK